MKITTTAGIVTAQAETIEDVKALLAYVKEPRHPYTRVAPPTKYRSKTCSECGESFKYRKTHMKKHLGVSVPFVKHG